MKPSTPTRATAPGVLPALPTLMLVLAVAASFSADGKAASWRGAGCASLNLHLQSLALLNEREAMPHSPQELERARRSDSAPGAEKEFHRPGPVSLFIPSSADPLTTPGYLACATCDETPRWQQASWLICTINLPPPTPTIR